MGVEGYVLGNNESEYQMGQMVTFKRICSLLVLDTDLMLSLFNIYLGLILSLFSSFS